MAYDYSYFWGGRIDPETPTAYETFDMTAKQELTLSDETAPAKARDFDAYVKELFRGKGEPRSDLGFYINDGTLMMGYSEFMEPEGAGTGNHTSEVFVEVPFQVLKKYLRDGSALFRLAPKGR